jgi:hypothetical protein
MGGTISTRWYFPDWLSDPCVRSCSLAARGLWMDILSLAASNKGRDHGFLVLTGRKPTYAEIARLVQSTAEEVQALIAELGRNGVFSVDKRGVIYSRRMVRNEKNRRNGREGGNPILLEQQRNRKSDKALIPEPEPEPGRIPPVSPLVGGKAPRKTRLPSEFQFSPAMAAYAAQEGFAGQEGFLLFERFCDHHRSKANVMADWMAAWRNWVRNEVKFSKQRMNGNGHAPRPGSKEDSRERTQAALAAFAPNDGTYDVRTGPRSREPLFEIIPPTQLGKP